MDINPTCRTCGRSTSSVNTLCALCLDNQTLDFSVGSRIFDSGDGCAATVVQIERDTPQGDVVTFRSDASVELKRRVILSLSEAMRPLSGRALCVACGHFLYARRARELGRHEGLSCPVSPIAGVAS